MEDPNYKYISTYTLTDQKKTYHVKNKESKRHFFYSIINFESEHEKQLKYKIITKLSTTVNGLHKNIINLTLIDLKKPLELRILSEFAKEGNLFNEVKQRKDQNKPFTYSEIKNLVLQLVSACLNLQRMNIAHLSIKLSSFVKLRGNLYKLTNFYISSDVHDINTDRLPNLVNDFISIKGTGENLFSPEVLRLLGGDYVEFDPIKSDVYCLGLVLLGAACLNDLKEFRRMGIGARYSLIDKMISESIYSKWLKSILTDMLNPDPKKRLDFEEIFIKYLDFKPRPKYLYEDVIISSCIRLKFVDPQPESPNQNKIIRAVKQFQHENSKEFLKELEFYRFFKSTKFTLDLFNSDETLKTLELDFHEHSLQDFLNENKYFISLFEGISKKFVYKLIRAFEFFESKKLVHGCIRPGHILVSKKFHPKIIDFSNMVKYDPNEVYAVRNQEEFKATELVGKNDSNGVDLRKAEVFSLGLVIFQLFAGYEIKKLNNKSQRHILDQSLESFPIQEIQSLLKEMLAPFPPDRPSFKALCNEYRKLLIS